VRKRHKLNFSKLLQGVRSAPTVRYFGLTLIVKFLELNTSLCEEADVACDGHTWA
jgi:hypothetical protein